MLLRLISRASNLRRITLIAPKQHYTRPICSSISNPDIDCFISLSRSFCSDRSNGGDSNVNDRSHSDVWKITPDNGHAGDSMFQEDEERVAGIADGEGELRPSSENEDNRNLAAVRRGVGVEKPWSNEEVKEGDIFAQTDKVVGPRDRVGEWETPEEYKPWTLGEDDNDDLPFDVEEPKPEASDVAEDSTVKLDSSEGDKRLEMEEQELQDTLKGPNRAFGDLIATSGITNEMLDNLIALKDFEGIEGLPPLSEIEELRLEKSAKKSAKGDAEPEKQREEVKKVYRRRVDTMGIANATGRRKRAVAQVWLQPGDGTIIINGKQFDIYFQSLEHRADILGPFSETKTLGRWEVKITVKGGGLSGQAGAVRLGISRALQNFEPGLRPPLRKAGLLTRDTRVVESKKYGRHKARKGFQWSKR